MRIINIAFILLLFIVPSFGQQSDFPERSSNWVNDYADLLSLQEENALERKLRNYSDSTSTRIVIVTMTSIGGYEPMDYAVKLVEHWGGLGGKYDNGALILVAKNERKLAIATGYGLEGVIPDAATLKIREEYINPYFGEGDFYTGLDKGTDVMIKLAEGEYTADNIPGTESGKGGGIASIIFIGFIIWMVFFAGRVNRRRKRTYGHRNVDFWTAMMLGSMLGGGRSSGSSWSDFSGGSGSFGGGFGGLGGGSFGGGGSAGSW